MQLLTPAHCPGVLCSCRHEAPTQGGEGPSIPGAQVDTAAAFATELPRATMCPSDPTWPGVDISAFGRFLPACWKGGRKRGGRAPHSAG